MKKITRNALGLIMIFIFLVDSTLAYNELFGGNVSVILENPQSFLRTITRETLVFDLNVENLNGKTDTIPVKKTKLEGVLADDIKIRNLGCFTISSSYSTVKISVADTQEHKFTHQQIGNGNTATLYIPNAAIKYELTKGDRCGAIGTGTPITLPNDNLAISNRYPENHLSIAYYIDKNAINTLSIQQSKSNGVDFKWSYLKYATLDGKLEFQLTTN